MDQLQASRPGYNLSTADLMRARISAEQLGGVIVNSENNDILRILAQIALQQRKLNTTVRPMPYGFAVYNRQMILAENPNRNYLIIQNVGNGDLMVVFEDGPASVEDSSANTSFLTLAQTRAIRIVSGGYYEPQVPPTNPVTIFTLNAATYGVVLEGQ